MKASEFKQLIKEAVKEAIREELTPAPQQPVQETQQPPVKKTGNAMLDILNETKTSMSSEDFRNIANVDSNMAQGFSRSMFMPQGFNHQPGTQAAMQSAPKVGLDISNLGFLKNAAEIVKVADQKQREKNGL